MGYLTKPFRVAYESKYFTTGLTNIRAVVLKPNLTVAGTYALTEMPIPMVGRYYFDFLTTSLDPEGEYFAAIISPSDGVQTTLRIPLYTYLGPKDVANAVWDEPALNHVTPGTFGDFISVIRQYDEGLTNEVVSTLHGLSAIKADIDNSRGAIIADINSSTSAIATQMVTQAEIQLLLGGIAQESTVQTIISQLGIEANGDAVSLTTLMNVLNAIKPQTDKIVNGGATETMLVFEANALTTLISALQLTSAGIKAKTDTIPLGIATEAHLNLIPTNPVLVNDPRLDRLDANVSSRSTLSHLDIAPLAKVSDVQSATSTVEGDLANLASALNTIFSAVSHLPDTTHLDFKFSSTAQVADIASARDQILSAIGGIGTGPGGTLTAADVWAYATKVVTLNSTQYDVLATNTVTHTYSNKMSTVYRAGTQELITWAEKDGLRCSGSNCLVIVKDADGNVKWSDTLATPNIDGIFKFSNTITATPNSNYYIVISIIVDGAERKSNQSFFTAG